LPAGNAVQYLAERVPRPHDHAPRIDERRCDSVVIRDIPRFAALSVYAP
jgi:hypothetical protein